MPAVADVQQRALTTDRQFTTQVAGLFLFVPQLLALDLPDAVRQAGLPGSEAIPPLHAFLALLLPKLLGHRRISHISDLRADEGAGLWAGLNVLPKTTYATDYSYRTDRTMHERLIAALIAKTPLGKAPHTFNLDFHAIPFRGHEPDLEKHWVPLRNRALPAVMAFVAQAAGRRIMCYATANVLARGCGRHGPAVRPLLERADRTVSGAPAVRFAGHHLCGLEPLERGPRRLHHHSAAWFEHAGTGATSACLILATLPNHPGQGQTSGRSATWTSRSTWTITRAHVRQLIVTGLGHEAPTFFLTNDRPEPQTARQVIQTYASRNHVENRLGEQITFFHLDCLCSDVRLNVDFDLTLTVVADLLYRCLAERLKGFGQASPHTVFRKFVDTPGSVKITADEIVVRLSKRAHNPLLKEACLNQRTKTVPWLADRCVRLECP